jgi:hypothetical protein
MAMLQTAKDLFPIRRWFQRRFLRDWLARKGGKGVVDKVEQDLIALATDGERNAFYDLPIEQLSGQIAAAAQVVMDYPARHSELLHCLASQVPKESVDRLLGVKDSLRVAFENLKRTDSTQARQELETLADAKARVMHQIQRNIDALQIAATYRWKFWFQLASFAVSFLLAYAAGGSESWPWATRVFGAIAAGFLAPVARDLQAKLQQVK